MSIFQIDALTVWLLSGRPSKLAVSDLNNLIMGCHVDCALCHAHDDYHYHNPKHVHDRVHAQVVHLMLLKNHYY